MLTQSTSAASTGTAPPPAPPRSHAKSGNASTTDVAALDFQPDPKLRPHSATLKRAFHNTAIIARNFDITYRIALATLGLPKERLLDGVRAKPQVFVNAFEQADDTLIDLREAIGTIQSAQARVQVVLATIPDDTVVETTAGGAVTADITAGTHEPADTVPAILESAVSDGASAETVLAQSVHWTISQAKKARTVLDEATAKQLHAETSKDIGFRRDVETAFEAANLAFNACLKLVAAAVPANASEAARQLTFLCETAELYMTESTQPREALAHALDVSELDLASFAARLSEVTDWERPTKEIGPHTHENGRLTASGVLYRYHAFLALELRNVGHQLYGNTRYAWAMQPLDAFVNQATDTRGYPNDLGKVLPRRARKVLRALGINTTKADR